MGTSAVVLAQRPPVRFAAPIAQHAPYNVAGDHYWNAIPIADSGSTTLDFRMATAEAVPSYEFQASGASAAAESLWLVDAPTQGGTLEIVVTDGSTVVIEIYDADFQLQGSTIGGTFWNGANADASAPLAADVIYYVRIHPTTQGGGGAAMAVSWTFTARPTPQLQLQTYGDLTATPDNLTVDIGNGDPGVEANVYLYPNLSTPVATIILDTVGAARALSVPIPAQPAGSYSVMATAGSSASPLVAFQVLNDPFVFDSPDPLLGTAGSGTASTDAVVRWVLRDPAPSGETFVLEINPNEVGSPFPQKVYTTEATTAWDGQMLTFEGNSKAASWTFSGYLRTKAMLNALQRLTELNRLLYLIDHYNRQYVVSLENFDAKSHRDVSNLLYSWDYTITANVYLGPEQL